ncbi:unnamed protein product [Chironomus riparius]|uniref:C2H2-type domain-containing protein n=1 Tax=Chironomus riparius TaxID=315576 RepID=A0A9N9RS33_9DIPT|nr:unnamed protein product [Chironomus riparius]
MPKSGSTHNDESDNDFSSANENSNLSEINPLVLSSQANLLRQATAAVAFSQNSSSSTSSLLGNDRIGSGLLNSCNNNNINININQNSNQSNSNAGVNSNCSNGSASKKFRHQNFSKNIYIGTKNAERWDNLRNLFQYKNDVEFVSFLLNTAENEARSNKNGSFKLPIFQKNTSNNHIDNSQDYEKEQSTSSFLQKRQQPQLQQQKHANIENQQHIKIQQPQQQLQIQQQQQQLQQQQMPKKVKRVQFQDNVNIINDDMSQSHEMNLSKTMATSTTTSSNDNNAQDHSISSTIDGSVSSDESNNTTEILDCRIEEKIKNELEEKQKMIEIGRNGNNGRYDEAPTPISSSLMDKQMMSEGEDEEHDDNPRPILSKRRFYDIRKAPIMLDAKLNELSDVNQDKSVFDFKDDDDDVDSDGGRLEINSDFMIRDRKTSSTSIKKSYKPKICYACNTKHGKETCPIRNPISSIPNQIDFADWIVDHPIIEPVRPPLCDKDAPLDDEKMFFEDSVKSENELDDMDDDEDDDDDLDDKMDMIMDQSDDLPSFAEGSLPNEFEFLPSLVYSECNRSIFTKIFIPKYTQIGPLVGVITPEVDIPDDCSMAYVFEIHDSILSKSIYYNLENRQKSNWFRYLQPARARDQRNLTMIKVEDKIYFVSCMDINVGCELLYWSDDSNSAWGKKKIEKTSCGGCNLRFEHPLHYRTHCSVFHDPGFSLTIRKYHCKVCGVAVLGKENIMKHAEKLHEGKGAYQCQYCKKFFLRLNYLEMHRTYGCSANPQRARPLCDFCGRKFCQPQKLKVHIKRMHSDMAEVLRDFQCKLCSKLLGSRAALQRHSKEVHSRNSAVVSCPRCQKLFQNRSNLKIHMLTHSGVRPFKCAEQECTAAFTTKQCLQFHYKKVHGYAQELMPKIERSVAYTFDAYSGGLQPEPLDGMTRRQRKLNAGEPICKPTKSLGQKETMLKDKNFLSSISDLCKNENNLNLLSSKISSILNCNLKEMNKKLMNNVAASEGVNMDDNDDGNEFHGNNDFSGENLNSSDMEAKMIAAGKSMRTLLQQKRSEESMMNDSISGNDTNDIDNDDNDDDDSDRNSFKAPINRRSLLENSQLSITSNPRFKDFLLQTNPNLVISKGSKKWISDPVTNMDMDDNDVMTQANRDFLAKLISSKLHKGSVQPRMDDGNEHSPILDVDSNIHHHQNHHHHHHNHQHQQQQQPQHQDPDQFSQAYSNQNGVQNDDLMDIQQTQYTNNANNNSNQSFNTHFNPLGGFYNGNANVNRNMTSTIPTSASLLVEAALSSVSSMIGNSHDINDNGNNQQMTIDEGHDGQQPEDLPDEMTSPEFQSNAMMSAVDENMKIMKAAQQNFPIHLPSMSTFSNSVNSNMMQENNEIDVDAGTPKPQDKMCAYTPSSNDKDVQGAFQNQQNDSCSPARTMTPDQQQHNTNYGNTNFNAQRNQQVQQIQTSPGQLSQRPIYGSEHDLVSPASTPSLPRYDFGAENYRARREKMAAANMEYNKSVHHQQQNQQTPQMTQLSSDDENSIVIAENLSISHQQQQSHVVNDKIKLNSQISDLMYANSKYSDNQSSGNQLHRESLNDLRLKYNEQGLEIQEFSSSRNQVVNENVTSGNSSGDYHQGLDMSSRAGIAGYHSAHNFQLASSAAASSNLSFNRYQHHIYDILTERDAQQNAQQQQQEHHSFQLQQQQQQIQHLLQDHISATTHQQDHDSDPSGVDLSRTSNYIVPPSPPAATSHIPTHTYSHSEMLRMASLDLSSAGGSSTSGMVGTNNSHHVRHHTSFLPPHAATNRDLSEHHRFLSTADQRLLVDPTAHLLIEQNNRLLTASENNRILDQSRLLTADGPTNRHVVSPRGFGAYHHPHHSHPHQMKYHHQSPHATSNQQQNYHPFSASYY